MKADAKVDPCPFCRSKKIGLKTESVQGKNVFWLYCADCQATGPIKTSEDEAIFGWGTHHNFDTDSSRMIRKMILEEEIPKMKFSLKIGDDYEWPSI